MSEITMRGKTLFCLWILLSKLKDVMEDNPQSGKQLGLARINELNEVLRWGLKDNWTWKGKNGRIGRCHKINSSLEKTKQPKQYPGENVEEN